MFGRETDLERYVIFLEKMIDAMIDTLSSCSSSVHLECTKEIILNEYARSVTSPNILEEILIKNGQLTHEEAKKNWFEDMLLRILLDEQNKNKQK